MPETETMSTTTTRDALLRGPRPMRVVVVDDHALVRRGLRNMIDAAVGLEICGEAGDVTTALYVIQETEPDLVLADVSMPGTNGLELIKKLRTLPSPPKVLVVSMHDERLFADRALNAGALGYVSKDSPEDTILKAIHSVLAGRVYLSPAMTQHLLQKISSGGRTDEMASEARLSDRELEVFEHIGRGNGTRDIAERLGLSVKTVESYRENIKHKLGLESYTDLVRRAAVWVVENS